MKRAAIYVRVSTQEQKLHGLSVDNQILAIQDYCKANNLIINDIYNDAGISARKKYTKRPELVRLIEDANAGKVDIILFTRLDRWFRSVKDYYEVMSRLPDTITWRAIWEDYETETSAGVLRVNIMLSVAQSESDRAGERVKSIMDYKRQKGDYVGSAPTGYMIKDGKLIKDENKKDIVQCIFDVYLKSKSITKAVNEVKKRYNYRVAYFTVKKFIRNPAYYGEARNGYKCEPYITKEQYDFICETMAANAAPRRTKRNNTFLFSGLLFCKECGHRMSGQTTISTLKDGTKNHYKNYICEYSKVNEHKALCIRESKLENILINSIDAIYELTTQDILEKNSKLVAEKKDLKEKSKLEAKLKRLLILFEEGDITEEDYKEKRDAIKAELSKYITQPIRLPAPLPNNWKSIYNDLDEEHKKDFWNSTVKAIRISNTNRLCPDIEFREN